MINVRIGLILPECNFARAKFETVRILQAYKMQFAKVENGVGRFLFNLIVLGSLEDSFGALWLKLPQHICCLEYTEPSRANKVIGRVILSLTTTYNIFCVVEMIFAVVELTII